MSNDESNTFENETNPCELCADPPECSDCDGSGEDGNSAFGCSTCGGSGFHAPPHCCACGGSPYCQCCPKCSSANAGICTCPIPVQMQDGTTRIL